MQAGPWDKYAQPTQDQVIAPADKYKELAEQRAREGQAVQAQNSQRQQDASTWDVMSPEDARAAGLPSEGTYRRNKLGRIETIVAPPAPKPGSDPVKNAKGIVTSAGIDLLSPEDRIADLIRGSTSGRLQEFGADLYGDVTGDSTAGMENIARLKTIVSDMTLQMTGGSLGNQISNADREFIMQRMGNLGDPSVPADQRLAAWTEVKERLARALGVDLDEKTGGRKPDREGFFWRNIDDSGNDLGGVYDENGNPLGPDGGVGFDKDGNQIALFSRATDDSPRPNGGGGKGGGSSFMDKLGTATAVTAKGAAKAVTGLYDLGMEASTGVQRGIDYVVSRPAEWAADAAGMPGLADNIRESSDEYQARQANQPTASDALDQIYATPKGYEGAELASALTAGLMLPGPKRVVPNKLPPTNALAPAAAREVIDAGRQAGVRVMTSDVRPPTTFTGKIARATGERIPYAGTGGPRAAQQAERVQAVRDLAHDFGADIADSYLDDIAADLAKTRGGQIATLARAKDAVIDGVQGAFTAPRTVKAIDEQVARLRGINEGAYGPVIRQLEAFKANILSGKTLRQVEGNRKLLGDMFEDANLASIKGDGQKAVNAIYGPLRDDMGDFIRQSAGDEAYRKWAASNKRLAALAGELDSTAFRGVLQRAETTPEDVSRLLFSKKPSEVRRLYQNLSPEGQAKARAGIIHMAVEKAGGLEAISPDRFANAIAQNSRSAGVVFQGPDLARLQGLERLLQYTKQASVASAAPPTGVQNAPMIGGIGLGATLDLGTTASLVGIYGMLARLYESAATRNLLIGLSKTTPGSKAEGQWIERIMKAAASQTERLGNAANDVAANSPGRAAAQDEQ